MIESTSQKLQTAGGAEREARELAEQIDLIEYGPIHRGFFEIEDVTELLAKALEKCANEARLEALEQAAALICIYCRVATEGGRWSKANSNGKHFDESGMEQYCQAYEIRRALKAAPLDPPGGPHAT